MNTSRTEKNLQNASHFGRYACGTLNYTLRSLAAVFIWLMIGGMTLSVFTALPGRMLPVKLQELGSSDFQNSIILAVIGGTLNIVICPIVGFKSDRYRSRWGRRIPFILMSLPFISLSLILFGFGDQIGGWLAAATAGWADIAPVTMTVAVIALVMFMFQFANMYVNSVFWYIFNDVIPAQFFGRVMGAFQVASNAGIAAFNFFIFQYAAPWYTEIFVVSGILYAIGMGLMCLMVKEGEYPPVTGEGDGRRTAWHKTFWLFCRESCCSRFYVLRYTLTTLVAISAGAYIFSYFYNREMGLDDNLIGKMVGVAGMISFGATFLVTLFSGILIDRWHPMRIYIYGILFGVCGSACSWKWLFGVLPDGAYLIVGIAATAGAAIFTAICSIASLPMEMLTFPKSRFGSFCSAQALIRSLVCTFFSLFIGVLFDWLRAWFPVSQTYNYRFVPVWQTVWLVPAAVVAYIMYREWGRLGGYKNYRAPASWAPDGREAIPQPETFPPNAGLLRLAIFCFDFLVLLTLAAIIFLGCWARQQSMMSLSHHLLVWALPCQFGISVIWAWVRRGIRKDIRLALAGETPHNGIPHHGLLLLVALRQFVLIGMDIYQVMLVGENGGFAFMIGEVVNCGLMVLSVYAAARMERGIVTGVIAGSSLFNLRWKR
ncbi:MFS transporter [Victivallis sp. Marseille-Q1083]|uniref:MFS transporter n=1 Tax=Victivallis sp. Marseille-Q1083 TaxID=2717288 RepID=UPI00158E96AC|nr:MFS transporter [Victivallis sp. Marseille-Q1083]